MQGKNGPVYQDIHRRGNAVLREARRLAPKDTGRLKQSMAMEMRFAMGKVIARVGTNVDYALFIHEGTANKGTGYIYPKKGQFLKFPVVNNSGKGRRRYKAGATAQYAYAKRVRGIKPTPFLLNALPAAMR
jgi:hypothetical protein